MLNNKTYDILKWVAQILLPAMGTLYYALSAIWGLPNADQVLGTIVAVDTFLGALLGISSTKYQGDGILNIDLTDPSKEKYMFEIGTPLNEVAEKDTITLKINAYSDDPGGTAA